MVDLEKIRADFEILSKPMNGKRFTFLDTAASAQKPKQVLDVERTLYTHYYANVHRGIYAHSQRATDAFEEARDKVKDFIKARERCECIFTRGATEAINLVAQTYGRQMVKAGDEIIVSGLEHHSNIVPWQMLAAEKEAHLRVIPVLENGQLDRQAYQTLLNEKTRIVAIAHVSNAIGTLNPVAEMIELAHKTGAVVLVDGCQAVVHERVDMQALDADFYVFSGHKLYGPTGIGILYGKKTLLEAMPPWQGGGDMIDRVSFEKTTYNVPPYKFEAGTPHIGGAIGLGAAIDYMNSFDPKALKAHEEDVRVYAENCLRGFNHLRIIGESPHKAALVSFVIDGIHPHDLGTLLDQHGVAVRVGHHCAQPLMERFAVAGTVRASFGLYNGRDDVDHLCDALRKAIVLLG